MFGNAGRSASTSPDDVEMTRGMEGVATLKRSTTDGDIDVTTRKGVGGVNLEEVLAISDEDIDAQLDREFPDANKVPNVYDVIKTCMTDAQEEKFAGAGYSVGDWVEVQGPDTQWRLTYVKRIVKQAPDDWDWNDPDNLGKEPEYNFYYNCGEHRMLEEDYLRSPQEGLRRIFGMRPWVWRAYALLRFENFVRFQKNHENDFDEVDAQQYARHLWNEWLHNEKNGAFLQRYEEVGEIAQQELLEHLLAPFIDIDDVTEDHEVWDFDDENISSYTYLAVCGSGSIFPVICMVMQFVIPALLLMQSIKYDYEVDNFFDKFTSTIGKCATDRAPPAHHVYYDDDDKGAYNTSDGKIMITLVVIFYLFKVVPDTFISFYNTAGSKDTTYSRIMSMRKIIWDQGDDYIFQTIGYKLDLYMNTAFECALYFINLVIIYNTNDILDVILNALAIEFVHQLDEDFRSADWWDASNRHIAAGVCELIIQKTLDLNVLKNPASFARVYHIDEAEVVAACGGEGEGLYNRKQALIDQKEPKYMNGEEALDFKCAQAAKRLKKTFAIEEYQKNISYFGGEGNIFEHITGGNTSFAVFNKLENFRVWSRWERVLYIGDIPEGRPWEDEEKNKSIESTILEPFKNHSVLAGSSAFRAFLVEIFETLTFIHGYKNIKKCLANNNHIAAFFRFILMFVDFGAVLIQILFPIFVLMALFYVPICY
mmetsp:Transcript_1892/g.3777  ORF Transcript_1892/g.3777 Transcript_1892/m.3777 type:complete len:708 (+) Transcript_1892:251-2374(+)